MISSVFGTGSMYSLLRTALDEITSAHRRIANRVANATTGELAADTAQSSRSVAQSDLERDMAELANNQLRFQATARLLERAYAQLRTAMRERV
jgi:hypothetical protein